MLLIIAAQVAIIDLLRDWSAIGVIKLRRDPEEYTTSLSYSPFMEKVIVLYDIPGNKPSCKAWSPNTWKARYVSGHIRILLYLKIT